MIKSRYNTNVKIKRKHFKEFVALLRDQFEYGGKKYGILANDSEKEATDIICDAWGLDWMLGTINKYLYRFKSQQREKDLLKITTYCYIIWLKMGFQFNEIHDTDTLKTVVAQMANDLRKKTGTKKVFGSGNKKIPRRQNKQETSKKKS